MEVLLYTILTLCALGVLSAVILYFVAQKFRVDEDPRIDEVEKTEAAAAEEDMARWDKKRDQALAEVERAYAEHKDQWVELLFSRIVGETERAEV